MKAGIPVSLATMLMVAILAGCGDDNNNNNNNADETAQLSGTFVGEVSDTDALVAVVTTPAAEGEDGDQIAVYVSDDAAIQEVLSGSASADGFEATSEGGDAKAEGKLDDNAVSGTVELPDGERYRYEASQATATAGLYELTVSSDGDLRGASAAGVGLKGESTMPSPGSGTVTLADGTSLEFEIDEGDSGEAAGLRAGQVRLIVLPDGKLRGAAMSRPADGGGDPAFFVLSSSK
jgi:hypothetical protein